MPTVVFVFACPGFFPFDPFFYCLNPFRPSCHFTFHITVLTTTTTQTSMPPVVFVFACDGFFTFVPFFLFLNTFRPSCHFTFHATVLTSNTTQTSMPPVGFEPTISVNERPQTHVLDRAATGIGKENITELKHKIVVYFDKFVVFHGYG
jgi:hypothetical protein